MCYTKSQEVSEKKLIQRYHRILKKNDIAAPQLFINGFSYPVRHIIKQQENQYINGGQWGFLPSYIHTADEAKDFRKKYTTLNARSEEVFDKIMFKNAIMEKRCLIPATAFIESRHEKKMKFPYTVAVKDCEIFSFAGIYNTWKDETGEEKTTYTILTNDAVAGSLMAHIHNSKLKQPLILPSTLENNWLENDLHENQIKELMQPFDNNKLQAHTIARWKTSTDLNDPLFKNAYNYQELNEVLTLF
jgi:putative SOS response-associated peptidase YedK